MSSGGSREQKIKQTLIGAFKPLHLGLENESSQHAVPPGSETHFKLLMVTSDLEGLSRVQRQQKVMALLQGEFKSGLHALTMRLYTPDEWDKLKLEERVFVSPPCMGGGSKDA